MDATNVKTFVVGFEKICKNAELVSTLSLSGHVSGAAYLVALRNSISASTGVDVAHWTVGGQFEINTRGSESLPAGLLVDTKRHLSQTSADHFFQEFAHVEIYKTCARGIADIDLASVSSSSGAAASAISAEPLTPKRDQPPRIRCGMIVRTRIFASCLDPGGRAGGRAATFGLPRDDPFSDQ